MHWFLKWNRFQVVLMWNILFRILKFNLTNFKHLASPLGWGNFGSACRLSVADLTTGTGTCWTRRPSGDATRRNAYPDTSASPSSPLSWLKDNSASASDGRRRPHETWRFEHEAARFFCGDDQSITVVLLNTCIKCHVCNYKNVFLLLYYLKNSIHQIRVACWGIVLQGPTRLFFF